MSVHDSLAASFEADRDRLRATAYRMLGSTSEADDAVQEAWLRLTRSDAGAIENLGGWLTTVTARVCLDRLRSRASSREEPLSAPAVGTIARDQRARDPEQEAALADSVGVALLIVLDRLGPAERIAFVLHDLFDIPFAEIGPMVGRSPGAAKKLASRARQRVRGTSSLPDADLARRWRVVDAFLAASRHGDLDALLAVLDPDVVRRADPRALPAGAPTELRGARAVAEGTVLFARVAAHACLAVVQGAPGLILAGGGRLRLAIQLTIENDRISEIDVIAEPDRLGRLNLAVPPYAAASWRECS